MLHSNISENDNYENDDLITLKFDSETINLYFSQIVKYSKHVREGYIFSDVIIRFPQEIKKLQEKFQLPLENIVLFFQLSQQNYNISDNSILTYSQCVDLLKISKYLEVRKLSKQIDAYVQDHNNDVDFVIQMIEYEIKTRNDTENNVLNISEEIENLLTNRIDECLVNEKFAELPISIIFRVIEQSSTKLITSDNLFDFIRKSLKKFCVLFQFLDIQRLSEIRLSELCEIYSKSDENTQKYFGYLKCNLNLISRMQKTLNQADKQSKEQQDKLKEFESKIEQLQKQNEVKASELEAQIQLLQKQLKDSKQENDKLQKDLVDVKYQIKKHSEKCQIEGRIVASVKSGLLFNAVIQLRENEKPLDATKSKYIVSTSNYETLGMKAYEKGEPITSLEVNTNDFICKSGTYYVRCIVFDTGGKSREIVSNPVTLNGSSVSFKYTGNPEALSLCEGKYMFEVWGAKGGDSTGSRYTSSNIILGGLGGYSKGVLKLDEMEKIYVYVGGEGKPGNSSDGSATDGGFPDGGGTKTGHHRHYTSVPGTGGGSTSIRLATDSDYSRIIVAGGGGGASGDSHTDNPGGFGGGLNGGSCYYQGSLKDQGSGTQTDSSCGLGYKINGDPGNFGHGATGKYCSKCSSGGGGGGGWYGGGSGGHSYENWTYASSGGGGSGWMFTESYFNTWKSGDLNNASRYLLKSSYYLTDTVCLSGNENIPKPDGNGTEHGHSGSGYAKITPI